MPKKDSFTNEVILGDCIKGMRKLEDGSVDLAFADPPFNIGYDYDTYDDNRSCEDYLKWSTKWLKEVVRVLKDDGTFWLAIGDEYAAELKVELTRKLGMTCRGWVVWYYTFGVHCKNKFTRSHAHLFQMVKNPKKFTFNADDPGIRVPSARMLVYGDKRANPKGRLPDDTWVMAPDVPAEALPDQERALLVPSDVPEGWVLRPQDFQQGFGGHGDVWFYSRVCGTFKEREGWHGCQMPEQLLGRIIRASSNEGETVLDPFGGSGTTLAVAKKLGRQYLGFELSEEYFQRIQERLDGISPGDALDGPENPVTSAPTTAQGRRLADVDPAKQTVRRNGKRRKKTDEDDAPLFAKNNRKAAS